MVVWFVDGSSACPSDNTPTIPMNATIAVHHIPVHLHPCSSPRPLQVEYDISYWIKERLYYCNPEIIRECKKKCASTTGKMPMVSRHESDGEANI